MKGLFCLTSSLGVIQLPLYSGFQHYTCAYTFPVHFGICHITIYMDICPYTWTHKSIHVNTYTYMKERF